MEAAIWGLPGIAVSLQIAEKPLRNPDFNTSALVARSIAEQVLRDGMPKNTLLNVNVPHLPGTEIQGIRVTRQGLRIYHDRLLKRLDPRQRPYYWIGGDMPTGVPEDGTDYGALMAGFISVTPIQLDLTAHEVLGPLRERAEGWTWQPGKV
jgi:5'-nucleotidase